MPESTALPSMNRLQYNFMVLSNKNLSARFSVNKVNKIFVKVRKEQDMSWMRSGRSSSHAADHVIMCNDAGDRVLTAFLTRRPASVLGFVYIYPNRSTRTRI